MKLPHRYFWVWTKASLEGSNLNRIWLTEAAAPGTHHPPHGRSVQYCVSRSNITVTCFRNVKDTVKYRFKPRQNGGCLEKIVNIWFVSVLKQFNISTFYLMLNILIIVRRRCTDPSIRWRLISVTFIVRQCHHYLWHTFSTNISLTANVLQSLSLDTQSPRCYTFNVSPRWLTGSQCDT